MNGGGCSSPHSGRFAPDKDPDVCCTEGWVGHSYVPRTWTDTLGEVYTGYWWGNPRERDHLEDPGADGRIILRWIFRKWVGWHGLDWSVSGYGWVAGTCKRGNEPPGSIKCGEFLD